MGIPADVFVATEADALEYHEKNLTGEDLPTDRYLRVEYKGLTSLEFGMLWAILDDVSWDVDVHMLDDLAGGGAADDDDADESWLCRFPCPFVELLAALPDSDLDGVSSAWADCEEMAWDVDDIRPALVEFRRLAKSALDTERGMFLWGSL